MPRGIVDIDGINSPEMLAIKNKKTPNDLADDPKYAKVKRELLAELENWRENVIRDQGVADTFRA